MPEKTYESMIEEIEKILLELDRKDISLEEAVKHYKTGKKVVDECGGLLDKIEKELRIVEGEESD